MLRLTTLFRTTALHGGARHAPFVDGALQLRKLHVAHRQASEDYHHLLRQEEAKKSALGGSKKKGMKKGKSKSSPAGGEGEGSTAAVQQQEELCLALEREFLREVESLRPVFTMSAGLEVSRTYTTHIYNAMRYFGCHDDPLVRQLSTLVGREAMRRATTVREEKTSTRRPPLGSGSELPPFSVPSPSSPAVGWSTLEENVVTTLPTELPHPPQVDIVDDSRRRRGALRIPARFRGHWVLQEPEIAITKQERSEDPW
eukprot:gene11705-8053_t